MKKILLIILILFSYLTSQAQTQPTNPAGPVQASPYREPSTNRLWMWNPTFGWWIVPDSVYIKKYVAAGRDTLRFTNIFKKIGTDHSPIIDLNLDTIKTVRMYNIGVDPTKGTLRKDTNQFLPLYLPANTTVNNQGFRLDILGQIRQTTSNSGAFTDFITNINSAKSFEIKSNGSDIFSASGSGTAEITIGNVSTRKLNLYGSIQDTTIFIANSGKGYGFRQKQTYYPTANNDTLFGVHINNKRTSTDGNIASIGSITAGSGYTNGTYTAQALTKISGTGSGINGTATIVVSGGAVTSVTIINKGAAYAASDILTASIPGGAGFSFPVVSTGSYSGVVYEPLQVKGMRNDVLAGDSAVVVDVNGNYKKALYGGGSGSVFAANGLYTDHDTVKMGRSQILNDVNIHISGDKYFFIGDTVGFNGIGAFKRLSDGSISTTVTGGQADNSEWGELGVNNNGGATMFTNFLNGDNATISIGDNQVNILYTKFHPTTISRSLTLDSLSGTYIDGINSHWLKYGADYHINSLSDQRAIPDVGGVHRLIDSLGGTGSVTSVSGTTNRITSTGGTTPVIDISASYVGQGSITTVGTLSAGSIPASLVTGLATAASPTASIGVTAVNGSASTFMRSDAAPKADTSLLRTVANSKTLAQEQTALNLKANIASPTFTGTVTIPSGSVLGTPTSVTLTNATGLPNAGLVNSTISGVSLGSNLNALTFGTHLTSGGSSYNGSAGVTITSDATSAATAGTIAAKDANANTTVNSLIENGQSITSAAGTTTLTVASPKRTMVIGSTTQTIVLPVVSTLVLYQQFYIINNSTGIVTVQSSGANIVATLGAGVVGTFTCQLITGTSAASWDSKYAAGGAAGSDKQVQYNNSGALTGSSNFIWDYTNNRLGLNTTPASTLDLGNNFNTSLYTFRTGSFLLQPYALNNGFITDNAYFDGSSYRRLNTGSTIGFQFFGSSLLMFGAASGSAGTSFTQAIGFQYTTRNSNSVGLGGTFTAASNNFSGASFISLGDSGDAFIRGDTRAQGGIDFGKLSTPTTTSITPSSSGGTLAAATYYYKLVALDSYGNETGPATEINATTTGSTGSVSIVFPAVTGAASYRIYQGTSSDGEGKYFTGSSSPMVDIGSGYTTKTVPIFNLTTYGGVSATGIVNLSTLTASKVVFTDASKNLTSTGIGTSTQFIAGDGSLGTIGARPHTIFTPTTGGTVSLTNNQYNIINPSGALLALTVNLPSSPANNDCVFIKYTQNVTTVTYGNGTVVDGITAPTAGGLVVLTYDSGTTSWY